MNLPHDNNHLDYNSKSTLTLEDIRKIATALGKPNKYRNGYTCCCPLHEDSSPSLSIWLNNQYLLGLKCYAGCNSKGIYNELYLRGLLPQHVRKNLPQSNYSNGYAFTNDCGVQVRPVAKIESDCYTHQDRALSIWNESSGIAGTIAETYLHSRKITIHIPYSALRFHPPLWHPKVKMKLPCIIAGVRKWPDDEIIGIHRTFLKPDGSGIGAGKNSKLMLGPVAAGAVRFTPMRNILMVGEGIETMLSSIDLYPERAIWAALSASNFQNLILPELPEASNIIIIADNDINDAGLKAAHKAAEKWFLQGRKVKIALPPEKGTDLNDVLGTVNKLGF